MTQNLGAKKVRRLEQLTGKKVARACVRGGWDHFVARVHFADGSRAFVNYRTGAFAEEAANP